MLSLDKLELIFLLNVLITKKIKPDVFEHIGGQSLVEELLLKEVLTKKLTNRDIYQLAEINSAFSSDFINHHFDPIVLERGIRYVEKLYGEQDPDFFKTVGKVSYLADVLVPLKSINTHNNEQDPETHKKVCIVMVNIITAFVAVQPKT